MNRSFIRLSALSAGLFTSAALAQTTAPQTTAPQTGPRSAAPAAPSTAPAGTAAAPQAVPAKVALIAFQQAVFATNEGQRSVLDVQKKYEPKKAQIDSLQNEVDSLRKQLQSAPATLSEEERATRLRNIDTKEKQLSRDTEDASNAYNTDLQEAFGKVAQKFDPTMKSYVQQNGFTLLLDVSNQASNVMWALQSIDVTQAVVDAYNRASGVAAPPPSAPSAATRPRPTTPSSTARPATR